MAIYSHSKLSTFEQCKLRYRLRYIDKIKPDIEKSIEAHLGTCVHDALEWLYHEVKKGNLPELDELIEKYINLWQNDYKENFIIVKKQFTAKDYSDKGIKFLIDYYVKHRPFQDGTLEMEKKVWVTLHPESPHKLIGYIDRLVYNKEKDEYEIHDYKTAKSLPNQSHFEKDRQLALYGIGIRQIYGNNKSILLTWHYLSHNAQVFSKRSDEQFEKLKEDTLKLIHKIEETTKFPETKTILCDWCEYKQMCPAWGNQLPQKARETQTDLTDIKKDFPTTSKYLKK